MTKKRQKKQGRKGRNWLWRFSKRIFVHTLQTVLFAVMLIFCLMAVVWILFLKTFNAQHISEEITRYLQQRLNRPVVISSLNLKFLNTVELKGFSVMDTAVAHGEALLSAESVTIRFQVLPLLEQRLVVDEVTLNRPRINIVRGEDGHYNVPEVQPSRKASVYTSQITGKKFTVSVDDWTIKDGVLSYRDLASKITHAVYGLNVHFEHLRFDDLSRFTVEMVLRNRWGDSISDMEIKGAGHVNFANFNWSEFALRSLKTRVYLFQKPVNMTLDLDNLRTPYFNLKAQVPAFEGRNLSLFQHKLPDFSVPKSTVTVKGILSGAYRKLKLSEAVFSAGDFKVTASGKMDFSAAPFSMDLSASTNLTDLANKSRYYAPLGQYKLTGKGSASTQIVRTEGKLSWPHFTLNLQDAGGDFYGFLTENMTGEVAFTKDFTDVYTRGTCGKLTVDKTVFDKLDLSGCYRKGNAYLNVAQANLDGVPMKLSVAINNIKSARRKIRMSLYLKHFEPMKFIDTVQDFVNVIARITQTKFRVPRNGDLAWLRNFRDRLPQFMPNFAGNMYADTFSSEVVSGNHFNLEFNFTGLLPGLKKLNGTLEASLQEGIVHQMEKLADEQYALNVTFQPFIIMHRMERSGSFKVGQVLKDVPFTDMAVSGDFENGRMDIFNAYTQGPSISAAVSGWVNWAVENFDIIIWTMFNNTSRSGALAENLTDESGNPALAFNVSQSMLKPKLEMLRAKKTGAAIRSAKEKGLRTDFKTNQDFIKGDFHAKK